MYRATIQLEKINPNFLITFNVILEGDPVDEVRMKQRGASPDKPVTKYTSNGYTVFKMLPRPYLNIDISEKRNSYDKSKKISLNRRAVFLLDRALKKLIENYQIYGNDWYKVDASGRMKTPGYEQQKYQVNIPCASNGSVIKIIPAPVPIDQNGTPGEGFMFCINRIENYTCLTVEDLMYFSYVIDKLDMNAMTIQLLQSEHIYSGNEPMTNHVIHNVEFATEDEPEHELPTVVTRPPNQIPEI